MNDLRPFFDYYRQELTYLRTQGAQFAAQHPKVANRLDLSDVESADPHVERLLESFAYLSARLQRDIDDQFPRIAQSLLDVLYPQFINPIPSMTIAQFETSPHKGKLTQTHRVPRGTELLAHGNEGEVCRFQTAYDVDLAPLTLTDADVLSGADLPTTALGPRLLRLRFKTFGGALDTLNLSQIRLYIAGNSFLQNVLFEALFAQTPRAAILFEGEPLVILPSDSLAPVGFGEDEGIIPYPKSAHPGYRLLMEYFCFPEKFLFLDLKNLPLARTEKEFTLLISLSDTNALQAKDVSAATFKLGCAPLINLFEKKSEPLVWDHRATEYRLVGDYRREKTTEIQSVKDVYLTTAGSEVVTRVAPYFSFDHGVAASEHQVFWAARRVPAQHQELDGSDLLLSFVDPHMDPQTQEVQTIFADLLCTNRDLAHQIPSGALLQAVSETPAARILCLDRPTKQIQPTDEGAALWRLVSHLSLNHLSFSNDADSLSALRGILGLYGTLRPGEHLSELDALDDMTLKTVMRRMGDEAWRGFVRGTAVTLTLNRTAAPDKNLFLFASVLREFFGLFSSINAFTELTLYDHARKGIWKQWAPLSGHTALV